VRRYLAELIGTFGLVYAGCGAIVINNVTGGQVTRVGIGLTFGLVVAAMIYASGHLSGAHLNPAVALALARTRHFPRRDLLPYWAAHLGGTVAAGAALRLLFGATAWRAVPLPTTGCIGRFRAWGPSWGLDLGGPEGFLLRRWGRGRRALPRSTEAR
jgi:glycerol uptake facilitator-like aquaporin